MKPFPKSLQQKLEARKAANALRQLPTPSTRVDFYSNDYLGFSQNKEIQLLAEALLKEYPLKNGATGSRLLSGNYELYEIVEQQIAHLHKQPSALLFNSGYNANVGFFSCVPQRGDVVFYDELIHASIRDGLQMSLAKNYNFKHNDFSDLAEKVKRIQPKITGEIYVVTESVFSMDGDSPNLKKLADFCSANNLLLVVDEAHALCVNGEQGQGLVHQLNIQEQVFAQIITFGKGLGCHGAAILGSQMLHTYLVNFARSLIYTTGLPPHAIATIGASYSVLKKTHFKEIQQQLQENIAYFNQKITELNLSNIFIKSTSAIHCCLISGNEKVKALALKIQASRFEVKPILSPTVAKGQERLRFCLHSYNSKQDIENLLLLVKAFQEQGC